MFLRHRAVLLVLLLIVGSFRTTASRAQDPAAKRLFDDAENLLSKGDAGAALAQFQLITRQFPTDELTPKALLKMARLYRSSDESQELRAALNKLLNDYPRTGEAASGFLIQAEMKVAKARTLSDLDEARSVFRRVPLLYGPEEFPGLAARALARIRGGELALLAGDTEAAEAEFVAVVEDEAGSPLVGRAALLLGRTLLQKAVLDGSGSTSGSMGHALETLQTLKDDAQASPDDRADAANLLSIAHRQILRPQSGREPWQQVLRFPAGGAALREPIGVAAAEDGRVLVVDRREGRVQLLEASGSVSANRNLKSPQRPAWSGDVALVVTDSEIVLPFDGRRMSFLEPKNNKERQLKGLRAAVRGPFGDWFMVAKNWKAILNYQTPRKGQELSSRERTNFDDLDRDSAGRVYALDGKNKTVTRVALDRRTQKTIIQGGAVWKKPTALAVDLLGNVYVLDRGRRQIHHYDMNGTLKTTVGPVLGDGVELRDPRDVAVDGSGRLFVADAKLPFVAVLD